MDASIRNSSFPSCFIPRALASRYLDFMTTQHFTMVCVITDPLGYIVRVADLDLIQKIVDYVNNPKTAT